MGLWYNVLLSHYHPMTFEAMVMWGCDDETTCVYV